ncbi:IPT/TIG domain-containing protein [Mucilaginibacter sp. McL0603]|uniref:IPT/TIG domain-containing protein n=1 Tax=Mucilaginibacter sp. McL0603 TaxID=3415670 RepID=UPI003CEC0C97
MNIPKPYLWLYTVILISCIISSCSKTQNTSLDSVFPLAAGGGDTLTLTGKNLALNGATPVIKLNDQPMTIIKSGPDELQVIVPKMAGSGKITAIIGDKTYTCPDFTYKYKATVSTLVGSGSFYCPWGITIDDNGDLYVAECYGRSIKKVTSAGQVTTISLPVTIHGANFYSPNDITLDKSKHDLYVTDFNAHLLKIGSDMSMSVIYNGDMPTTGIALGADGYLYMSNNTQGVIYQMNTDGSNVKTFASGIRTPRNIIFDQSNNMYVAGYAEANSAAAIFKVDKKGTPSIWLEDQAFGGWEIAIDKAGNFYEADHFHNVIRMIEKNGKSTIIAGNGNPADVDGVGVQASLNGPQGLAIDADGNLYVSTYNYTTGAGNEIRKIVIE